MTFHSISSPDNLGDFGCSLDEDGKGNEVVLTVAEIVKHEAHWLSCYLIVRLDNIVCMTPLPHDSLAQARFWHSQSRECILIPCHN